MTTDDLPFDAPDSQPNLGAAPARRHRHEWVMAFTVTYGADGSETRADWLACRRCGAVRNEDCSLHIRHRYSGAGSADELKRL